MATFTLPVVAPAFDLAEWALVARAWNAFRTPGVPQHDRIAAGLGRAVAAGCGMDRTADVQPAPAPVGVVLGPWRKITQGVGETGAYFVAFRHTETGEVSVDESTCIDGEWRRGCLSIPIAWLPLPPPPDPNTLDTRPEVQPPPPKSSRWARLGDRTSPSGKTLYRCGGCGRDSATCDKSCPAGCHS